LATDRPDAMHEHTIIEEFTRQAETFNAAAVANAPGMLEALIELAEPAPDERWLEAACGPGIVSRALAPRTGSVLGVDATPAMIEVARREAAAAGLANTGFATADVTALAFPDGLCRARGYADRPLKGPANWAVTKV